MISQEAERWLAIEYTVSAGTTGSRRPRPISMSQEIPSLGPAKRRDADHEKIRCATERLGHEREAPSKAEPIGHASRCSPSKEITRYMDRAEIIADCAAKHGCFRRGDAREHIAPAGQHRDRCCRSAETTNINAHDIKSLLRPFPLDVAPRSVTVAVDDQRPRFLIVPGDGIASDLDTAKRPKCQRREFEKRAALARHAHPAHFRIDRVEFLARLSPEFLEVWRTG